MRKALILLAGLGLLFGAGAAEAVIVRRPAVVVITGLSYHPATVTVRAGGTITFVNLDAATLTYHTASYPVGCTPGKCLWTTPLLTVGRPASQVKIALPPGTYTFYCQIHTYMRGTVKVSSS